MIIDIVIKFFTGKPDQAGILYVVFGLSLLTYILLSVLPEEKAIKIHRYADLHDWDKKYDASQTVQRSKDFALWLLMYSLLVLILGYIFGDKVINIGFWLFFPIALVLGFIRGDYVKKE